jgi:hypothetical protein
MFRLSFAICLLIVEMEVSATTLDVGKVAKYDFSGNLNDAVNGNNFITSNGLSFSTDRFGNSNNAVLFSNSSSYGLSGSPIDISGNQSRTVSLWVKANNLNSDLLGWGNLLTPSTGQAFLVHITPENGNQISVWGNYADIHSPNLGATYFSEWKQLVYVFDGSVSNSLLYVNGNQIPVSQQGAIIYSDTFSTDNTNLRIGDRGDGRGLAGVGTQIDDVSIYSRALSSSEVLQLYQTESVPEPSALSLLAVGLGGLAMIRRRRS